MAIIDVYGTQTERSYIARTIHACDKAIQDDVVGFTGGTIVVWLSKDLLSLLSDTFIPST